MNPDLFMTKSLRESHHGENVAHILATALDAVDPKKAVQRFLHRDGTQLTIDRQIYELDEVHRVLLIGFGKASVPMGKAAAAILGDYLSDGILITKGPVTHQNFRIPIIEGAHPVPDQRSIEAGRRIKNLLSTTTDHDLLICLISGGGSALLVLPADGISLEDMQALTKSLLACGATINEINCLRKHLSQVKGGQLARIAAPAKIATLILSDVIGDPLDVIASGPTAPDLTNFSDGIGILEKYKEHLDVPEAIQRYLLRGLSGEIIDTPRGDDWIFENVQNIIIGNNYQATKAAIEQANEYDYNTLLLTTSLQGEARIAGKILASIAKQVATTGEPIQRPACIIAGGETTVTLSGDGHGGRNQELALGAVEELDGVDNIMLVTLATDGDDGPTDAAGAVVTGDTLHRANLLGNIPQEYLARNASYEFFDALGDLLKPGMTGTNVNDLTFLIIF